MKLVRISIWGIIIIVFTLLASIPVVWAAPGQSTLNQTIPTGTPAAISTAVVPPDDATPTATPIPLLPPSGSNTQGNSFFILTGIFLAGSILLLLLNVLRRGRQSTRY